MTIEIIVEDGSIVEGANSYVSVSDASAFLAKRGYTLGGNDDNIAAYLLQAMDGLDLDYKGYRVSPTTQPLPFPRSNVYLSDNRYVPIDSVPDEMIAAQIWLAYYIKEGSDISAAREVGVIKEVVDVIEVEYAEGQLTRGVSLVDLPNVKNNLKHLVKGFKGRIGRA
jgi:hypothetical protein